MAARRVLLGTAAATAARASAALPVRFLSTSCPACADHFHSSRNSSHPPQRTPSAQQQQQQRTQRPWSAAANEDAGSSGSGNSSSRFDDLTSIGAPIYQPRGGGSGSGGGSDGGSSGAGSSRQRGPIRDADIRSRWIYLVDFSGAAGGGLTGPHRTQELLAKIDRKKFWIQQVSAQPGSIKPRRDGKADEDGVADGETSASGREALQPFPVCKIVAKKEEFDQARAAAKRKADARNPSAAAASASAAGAEGDDSPRPPPPASASTSSAPSHKDLQMTWSSTPHDISYKVAKARRELLARAPNSRLTIRIATKKGSGRHVGTPGTAHHTAELARKREFLDRIHAAVCAPDTADGQDSGPPLESADVEQPVPGGVARLSAQGVQWQGQGSMAVLVYEPVV